MVRSGTRGGFFKRKIGTVKSLEFDAIYVDFRGRKMTAGFSGGGGKFWYVSVSNEAERDPFEGSFRGMEQCSWPGSKTGSPMNSLNLSSHFSTSICSDGLICTCEMRV
jgi:hypothetical protein